MFREDLENLYCKLYVEKYLKNFNDCNKGLKYNFLNKISYLLFDIQQTSH